jgi:hypothetical protein
MNMQRLIIVVLAWTLCLAAPLVASAQAVKVFSAEPDSAPQGTQNREVTIKGQGFEKSAKVFFYKTGTTDPGGISVGKPTVVDSETIRVTIDIDAQAEAIEYDIEVKLSRGRGGRGTTLFKVQENKAYYTCDEVFGLDASVCNCTFDLSAEGGQGTPSSWTWSIRENCITHATLKLQPWDVLSTAHGDEVLTAGANFDGRSVVANTGHRNKAFSLNIEIAKGAGAGCGEGKLNSAIGFVLDKDSVSPTTPDHDGRIYTKTRLRAWGINIDRETGAAPLCHGIEFRRESSYDTLYDPATYDDAQAFVHDVLVTAGTYERSAIRVAGFWPSDSGGRGAVVAVYDSTIQPSAGASAIEFGPVNDGPGEVLRNVITTGGGVGIQVNGSGSENLVIQQNTVTGAQTAIRVDFPADSILFKSNMLTGDGTGIGICSDAVSNAYKTNRIRQFDTNIQEGGCTPSP